MNEGKKREGEKERGRENRRWQISSVITIPRKSERKREIKDYRFARCPEDIGAPTMIARRGLMNMRMRTPRFHPGRFISSRRAYRGGDLLLSMRIVDRAATNDRGIKMNEIYDRLKPHELVENVAIFATSRGVNRAKKKSLAVS